MGGSFVLFLFSLGGRVGDGASAACHNLLVVIGC